MTAIVERCIRGILPADTAQTLFLLRVFPVRDTLAELLVILPAADVGVTGRSLDEGAGAVLLVIDPVSIVRVAVLEGVETMAVALAELESAFVGGAAVVEHLAVSVTMAILDLALVVFGGEVIVCEVAVEVCWEIAGKRTVCEEGLRIGEGSASCEGATLFVCLQYCDDNDRGVVQVDLEESTAILNGPKGMELFLFPDVDLLLVFHWQTKAVHKRLI